MQERDLRRAAEAIQDADALMICAGAGIGVDSGLPDFRGDDGFWKAYPLLREAGMGFTEIANPDAFHDDPGRAWGFYGHRLNLYRCAEPHAGFALLKQWADARPLGGFVFTSNVDGHFEKAGFAGDRVAECHGSLNRLQCLYGCTTDIWSAEKESVAVDRETMRATAGLPRCPRCLRLARPNVLMFNDWGWLSSRADAQEARLEHWLGNVIERGARLAVIEIGAGRAIPTVRVMAEHIAVAAGAALIRVNPRDCVPPARGECIALPLGARDALEGIADRLPAEAKKDPA